MAAPALWMQPAPPIPNDATAAVNGFGMQNGTIVDPINVLSAPAMFQASATGTVDNNIPTTSWTDPMMGITWVFPGVDYQMTGMATSQVIDMANPGNGSGAGNVGNFGVSANTVDTIQWTTVGTAGSPTVFDDLTAGSGWSRAYFLADSDAAPAGSPPGTLDTYASEWLQETYTATYLPPDPDAAVIPGGGATLNTGPGLSGGTPTGGLFVTTGVTGWTIDPATVTVGGRAIPVSPDPITGSYSTSFYDPTAGLAATVTGTPTTIRVVASFQITALPYTTFGGVVAGPNWFATNAAGLAEYGASSITDPVGQSSMTTHYDASFSNFPVTTLNEVPTIPAPPAPPAPPPPPIMPPPPM